MEKRPKAPYLDNIETSCPAEFCPEPNNINASENSEAKKLYTAIENLGYYKKLTERIYYCLHLCDDLLGSTFADKIQKLHDCGTLVCVDESGCVVSANFCRLRFCPMCQKRRSLRIASDFKKIMEYLSNFAWVHLVLTVPNCQAHELRSVLDDMQIASSRLFRFEPLQKAFKGIARCTEITYNSTRKDYHPHFHCLIAVNKSYFKSRYYLPVEYIRKLWTVVYNAHVSGIKVRSRGDKYFFDMLDGFDFDIDTLYQCNISKADTSAVAEIAKYCVKPLEIDGVSGAKLYRPLEVIYRALHGRRLVQTYGVIKEASQALRVDFDTFEDYIVSDKSDSNSLDKTNVRSYNWNRTLSKYVLSVTP